MNNNNFSNLAIVCFAMIGVMGFTIVIIALLRDIDIRMDIRPRK